jgi:hypothetical protein
MQPLALSPSQIPPVLILQWAAVGHSVFLIFSEIAGKFSGKSKVRTPTRTASEGMPDHVLAGASG